jgi:hypothetical protein
MKKVLLAVLVIGFMGFLSKTYAEDYSKIKGTWKVSVPDAPYEYSISTLSLTEEAGKLVAKVIFDDGQIVKPTKVTYAKGKLSFVVNIEYNDIPLTGLLEKDKITGTVQSPDGTLNFTATRKEEKKKK